MPAPELFSDSLTFGHVVSALRAAGCVFAEDEARLLLSEATSTLELAEWVDRRVAGEPLEYILGWAEFCGLRIAVDPGVFVPRRRTGLLVSEAVTLLQEGIATVGFATVDPTTEALAAPAGPPATPRTPGTPLTPAGIVVDLCCGSGAVGVAIASRVPGVELHAADIDPVAVSCGRRNVTRVGGQIYQGDLYSALPSKIRGRVRLLAVNAPYVPTGALYTMPLEARNYEPRISLDGGTDGLDLHRRVIAEAAEWLAPGGHLLIETSERQAAGTAAIMASAGFAARTVHSDELDGTVVIGSAPRRSPRAPGHHLS
ncbi:methyltransferase [Arthrobacter sp. BE255]|uniref:methyltransferase n=1 Tax=Arthrobacter sp. BE255 TaxID=2817721 RepID=UPI00286466AC|nr:methyltransferase [Arthrobacter sp. BE255]MDR7158068.1 release factor glutamine methyltransferase [Arthrobacter sp. BE255]